MCPDIHVRTTTDQIKQSNIISDMISSQNS